MHELAAQRTGTLPRARWLHAFVTFAILGFAFLVSAEEADARLAGRIRLATAESAIGSSRLTAIDARADESPCAAQPAYPVGSLGGLFSRPGLIGGFAAGTCTGTFAAVAAASRTELNASLSPATFA